MKKTPKNVEIYLIFRLLNLIIINSLVSESLGSDVKNKLWTLIVFIVTINETLKYEILYRIHVIIYILCSYCHFLVRFELQNKF